MPIYVGQLFDPDLLAEVTQKNHPVPAVDETRRNLYVLGLPHDFTLEDFKALFQPFGHIEHAVILAVLDNFSRRRGFVVFSSHTQARAAMRATHKTTVKGHQLNVSWAVVQRSSGFLDGADRMDGFQETHPGIKKPVMRNLRANNPLGGATFSPLATTQSQPPQPLQPPIELKNEPINHSPHSFDFTLDSLGTAFASTLLVSNLCPWLFQTHIDVHALFAPYGFVKRITIIPPVPTNPPRAHYPHAALVEYDDLQNALSALYQVNGRPFGTCIARASLFRDAMQRAMLLQGSPDINRLKTNAATVPANYQSPVTSTSISVPPQAPQLNVH
ncbi:hypothetical protein M408DRAFT_283444 [Serendipita vermifera MAFF 305830]|uniref:RRM domain-containing protein n=1 Tax=Serendipita vermifera MAFF 305830 TaxID=933852 RepID=A0A0C3ARA5_SERVB|nr:hypothetical protein M408DRAFT_283444 [Serendipita vermifera MAFF 305830]